MPFTFSAGSFSFLKSSTATSQSNIKQNNNVDNVNNNNNNIVNDNNLDMGKNHLSPLNNTTVNVIPMVRRVRSLDNSTPPKSNRRTSNASNLKNTNNRKVWYKSLFVRIHQTLTRSNDDDGSNNDDDNNNNNSNDHDCDINNTVVNNNNNVGSGVEVVTETGNICDDDPIIMKSKNVVNGTEGYSFICHGNTHDFYVVTKNGTTPKCSIPKWTMSNGTSIGTSIGTTIGTSISNGISMSYVSNGLLSSGSLSSGSMLNGSNDRPVSNGRPISNGSSLQNDSLKPSSFISSSVFEECAKTPRHFAKEPEVLGKVGRFTIVREREDFDTTYFDQCHCQQKPCRFSSNGCSGAHPILPPDNDNDHDRPPVRNLIQQVTPISNYSCSNKNDSWSSSKSNRSFYSNNTPSSNSSRNSLPSLQQKYNNNLNGSCPTPIPVSKVTPHNVPSSNSSISRVILPQSSSSPNLVHLNQRSKIENKNISKNINNGLLNPNNNIIVVGNHSGKYPNPSTNNNGSYYPQCNNYSTTVIKKSKKPSLVNIKSTEEQQRRLSMPPTPTPPNYQPLNSHSSSNPSTPTNPSKFSLHHPNEPHTTINSHSGRKFEVEWNTTSKSSSSSSTSSTSSSDTAYSPPSTISSVFSMASSPDKKSTISNNSTLSRRCSTLSSKCGRKFEVTILSSSSSSNNCVLNTSPHSTIGSVNSMIVDAANTDSIKY